MTTIDQEAGTRKKERRQLDSPGIPDNLRALLLGEAKVLCGFELWSEETTSAGQRVRYIVTPLEHGGGLQLGEGGG
jgi:hypothetical protein